MSALTTVSDFTVEIDDFPLRNQRGEVYHTTPAEKCRVGVVSRRRIGRGPDGKDVELPQETEAAFIRGSGGWLPSLFCEVVAAKPDGEALDS